MRLIFVGEDGDISQLKKYLDKFAGSDWERQHKNIRLVTVSDRRNPKDVRARLKKEFFSVEDTYLYLLRNDIRIDLSGLPEPLSVIKTPGNLEAFLNKHLRPALQEIGADWRKNAEDILESWEYPEPDEAKQKDWSVARVTRWLDQFERLAHNEARKIGEMLLRRLECLPRHELITRFQSTDVILPCVMSYENGKSADVIAGLLKKGVMHNNGTVHNFDVLIRGATAPQGKIAIFEDGLFSGMEWVGIFESLMGRSQQNPKCLPLNDISVLQTLPLEIRFAVATTVGIAWLQQQLDTLNLRHVELKAFETIEVLSPVGRQRLAEGTLFSNDGKIDSDSISPRIFQDARWFGDVTAAISLCEAVGRDLWKDYWDAKGKPITADNLDRVALGASNLGFALAFPFSVPKVTLPLFWCSGIVKGHSRNFQWTPLFPNAA